MVVLDIEESNIDVREQKVFPMSRAAARTGNLGIKPYKKHIKKGKRVPIKKSARHDCIREG